MILYCVIKMCLLLKASILYVMVIICGCFSSPLPQDQLSADMYSFMAKEIEYARYFQTVSRTVYQNHGSNTIHKCCSH